MVEIARPNPYLKQLLKDLERKGGRHKADFYNICETNQGFYGIRRSAVRRKYQEAVDRLKRRYDGQRYKEICEENGVIPCAQTCEEAMDELKERMAKASITETKAETKETKAKTKAADADADAKPDGKKVVVKEPPPRATTPPPIKQLFSPVSPGFFASDATATSTTDQTLHDFIGSIAGRRPND